MTVSCVPSRPLQYFKAIALASLPSGTKATCWAIATFADNETGKAYPSLSAISKAAGLSAAVISKHTARAEAAGYLRKDRRMNSSIIYTIAVPAPEPNMGASSPEAAWIPQPQSSAGWEEGRFGPTPF